MNKINLYRGDRSWMARFSGPHAAEVIDTLGTDTVPTPYPAHATCDEVRNAISALNPGAEVVVDVVA